MVASRVLLRSPALATITTALATTIAVLAAAVTALATTTTALATTIAALATTIAALAAALATTTAALAASVVVIHIVILVPWTLVVSFMLLVDAVTEGLSELNVFPASSACLFSDVAYDFGVANRVRLLRR